MRTRHHVVPLSRGGSNSQSNIKIVEEWQHACWHQAWGNKTPQEVIHSIDALRSLFGDVKLSDLELIISIEWS